MKQHTFDKLQKLHQELDDMIAELTPADVTRGEYKMLEESLKGTHKVLKKNGAD